MGASGLRLSNYEILFITSKAANSAAQPILKRSFGVQNRANIRKKPYNFTSVIDRPVYKNLTPQTG
jgi:hypothetical protein